MKNLNISNSEITFRIDIDFENCEVDMIYKEMANRGVTTIVPSILCNGATIPIDKSKLKYTPTEESVDFCLQWLSGYVDRNKMCIKSSKWDKDYSQSSITKTDETGFKYTTWPDVITELESIGVEVQSTYGLMMGCCHLICACSFETFSTELVNKVNKIVKDVFKKYVVYYKN